MSVRTRIRATAATVRLAAAGAAAGVALLAVAAGAGASPRLEAERARAQDVVAEIREIDEDIAHAAESYNGANWELGRLTAELTDARKDLARARRAQAVAQQRVAARLRQLYVDGEAPSWIEAALGARSFEDILDEIDLTERVAHHDASLVDEIRATRARITARERQLAGARERQAAIVARRAAEKRAIEAKLVERTRLLATIEDEIAGLEAAERRRQAELRLRAQAELERQRLRAQQPRSAPPPSEPPPAAAEELAFVSTPPPDASRSAQVVAIALQYLGIPYVWGGADPSVGFDCSGLIMYVYGKIGITLPHYAAAQYQLGRPVARSELQPGDLVFFNALSHMGMYIGGGNFIHAPRTGDVVKISSLSEPYYLAAWVGARRIL